MSQTALLHSRLLTMLIILAEVGHQLSHLTHSKQSGFSCVQLPAGLIDKGETAAHAALRELKEETGKRALQPMP